MHKLVTLTIGAALALGGCQKGKSDDPGAEPSASQTNSDDPHGGDRAPSANPHLANQARKTRVKVPPPPDVAAPPADAEKTDSGIYFKVLQPGKGDQKPGRNDTVHVNYTGWKANGDMFYTSQQRGSPQPMSLAQTAPGWTEALQLMTVGEKRRYWIPGELAFRSKRRTDQGSLVFEIELVGIEPAPPVPPDVAAPPADAKKTPSGLAYKVIEKGTGTDKPRPWDQVTLEYTGWTTDGHMFDSTTIRKRARPVQLFRESRGWEEAVTQMVQGQKNRVWIPEKLLKKRPGQPDGMLVYEFKVVALQKMTDPPPVPKDVAAPPADAKKTAKGVSYKVLKKGSGTEHPTAAKTVTVHYTGWTTDGRMFDSSVVRDKPSEFPLSNVIPGWTDGIQVMAVGDQARFWIPKEMAYDGKPGRPQGMLVFDIELLEIKDTPKRRPMPGHVRGPGGVNLPGGMNLPNRGGKAHGGPGGKAHGGSGGKGRKPGMVPQQPPAPAQ